MKEEIFKILEKESSLNFTLFGKLLEQLDKEGLEILHDVLKEIRDNYNRQLDVYDLSRDIETSLACEQGWEEGVEYMESKGYRV